MAAGERENDVVELEAMPKDTFSWHPCNVSLCPSGLGLIVKYEDEYLEEKITDKQDALARIRVRSTPLHGDDCFSLQQGDHVLAPQNSHAKDVFYDARIEKAILVKHSERTHCRCSFAIKWLHQALEEGELTVPASSIMKLAARSINHHPVISTFFSILGLSSGLRMSPCSVIDDSMNQEMDINILLEKQIEQISNSADVSQKNESKDFGFGLEVDPKGESHGREIDASLKDPFVTIPLQNNLKYSTGSENKQLSETIMEITPDSTPVQEFTGSRLPVNPLAARAVLASLRSEFPVQEKGDITGDSATKLLHRSKSCSFSAVDHPSSTDDFSSSAKLGGKSPNFDGIVKTLFPSSIAPQIIKVSNVSHRAQVVDAKTKNRISGKKTIQPSETRLTRAQIRTNNEMQASNLVANTKETQLNLTSTKTRRATHSTVDRAEKVEIKECNATFEEKMQTECIKLEKDGFVIEVNSKKRTLTEDAEKCNYPKRLTRSAAQEVTGKNNAQPKLKGGRSNFSESNELDNGNVSTMSNRVKTSPNCAESGVSSNKGTRGKSAIPKKQEKRFSPRLRFLPRTRSQRKA